MEDAWVEGQRVGDRAVASGKRKVCGETFRKYRSGECARPGPDILAANVPIVELFDLASSGPAVVYANAYGFEDAPRALDPVRLAALAESHGVLWDDEAARRVDLLAASWRAEIDRTLSAEAERMKAEREAKGR